MLQKQHGEWAILGDPTEGALVTLAAKAGIEKDQWQSKLPRMWRSSFFLRTQADECDLSSASRGKRNGN